MFIFPWCALRDKLNIEPEVEQEGYSDMLRKVCDRAGHERGQHRWEHDISG